MVELQYDEEYALRDAIKIISLRIKKGAHVQNPDMTSEIDSTINVSLHFFLLIFIGVPHFFHSCTS